MAKFKIWLHRFTHTRNAMLDAWIYGAVKWAWFVIKWAMVIGFIAFNWYATFVWGLV